MGFFTEKQYKSTCKSCGQVWCYTQKDLHNAKQNHRLNEAKKCFGAGSFLLGGGLLSMAVMSSPQLPTFSADRCPNCGSRRVIKQFDRRVLK